mmetsp:Transcript_10149/g.22733  ORF Transcript_10149/g.22733 Transcript_10149/m.22733 type:complete len:440 (+) Transcript_10149:130-1449(+)
MEVVERQQRVDAEQGSNPNELRRATTGIPSTTLTSSMLLFHYLRSNWISLLLGQFLSILLATSGATQSTLHLNCSLSAPTASIGLVYMLLSLHLVSLCKYRNKMPLAENEGIESNEFSADPMIDHRSGNTFLRMSPQPTYKFFGVPLHAPPYIYLIMAFLDVEANYLTVLAYRYTTLTSISLFDALAIPSTMVLSRCLLNRTYTKIHLLGIAMCMVGVVVNVLQDYESDEERKRDSGDDNTNLYPYRIRGDILAIAGGILYGINDTLCEASVRAMGFASEFLGMVGLFAFVISIVQAAVVERDDIAKFFHSGSEGEKEASACSLVAGWGLLLAFVLLNLISYSLAAQFLLLSEAAFFNLSLLTGDLWTVVFSVTAQHIIPGPLFFAALTLIVGGVCVYEMAPSPVAGTSDHPNGMPGKGVTQADVKSLELTRQSPGILL